MQRALVMLAVFLLVTVALVTGVLVSHWPFWSRAWQWQTAAEGWPEVLPGPTQILRGGTAALPLHFDIDPVLPEAAGGTTAILLRADADGHGRAFLAPGYTAASLVDGRGLATGLLAPLYGLLGTRQSGLLDAAAGTWIRRWGADSRGGITPRQLLWQLSGLPAGDFQPLNPASRRAQLASGPDFERAARHWQQTWPAGSHFERSPVNAQLLALLAAQATGLPYAQVLEQQLWSQLAATDAVATLDRPRGGIAAHCCLRAAAADWLRLGLLLADGGRIGARQLLPAGFVDELSRDSPVHPGYGLGYRVAQDAVAGRILVLETTGRQLLIAPDRRRALLWIGTGPPPAQLHRLLGAEAASPGDRMVTGQVQDQSCCPGPGPMR